MFLYLFRPIVFTPLVASGRSGEEDLGELLETDLAVAILVECNHGLGDEFVDDKVRPEVPEHLLLQEHGQLILGQEPVSIGVGLGEVTTYGSGPAKHTYTNDEDIEFVDNQIEISKLKIVQRKMSKTTTINQF